MANGGMMSTETEGGRHEQKERVDVMVATAQTPVKPPTSVPTGRPKKQPVKKPVKKTKVTGNPVTWLVWSAQITANSWRRTTAARRFIVDVKHDGRVRKAQRQQVREARRPVHTVANPQGVSAVRKRGWVECMSCNHDGSSSWHPPSAVQAHMDSAHPAPKPAAPAKPKTPRRRATNPTKAAAAAVTVKIAAAKSTPKKTNTKPTAGTAGNSTNKAPQTGRATGTPSAASTKWRIGMAHLDDVVSSMNVWANNPPETWSQEMAEAETAADVFRGVADAFRRRGEVLVSEHEIHPDCVEPYDDAARLASEIGDQIMEVASRLKSRYGELHEKAEAGEIPKIEWLKD